MTQQSTEIWTPLVSLIIPAKNEAQDIAATLDACLAMTYEPKEILVVDDSDDETPEIVASYADRGVRLLHRDVNENGCCGARNLGMRSARGEIIVLVNADDRPEAEFLDRVLAHYRQGADFLVVESRVNNLDNPWACWVHASHLDGGWTDPHWSEGFSARRSAAEAVGYIPGDYPIPFCRDLFFGMALREAGYHKHYDPDLPMDHKAPSTFDEFWGNRVWRGTFPPAYAHYVKGVSVWLVPIRELLRLARTVGPDLLVLPLLLKAARYSRHLGGGMLRAMLKVELAADGAAILGSVRGTRRLIATEGWFGARRSEPEPTA